MLNTIEGVYRNGRIELTEIPGNPDLRTGSSLRTIVRQPKFGDCGDQRC